MGLKYIISNNCYSFMAYLSIEISLLKKREISILKWFKYGASFFSQGLYKKNVFWKTTKLTTFKTQIWIFVDKFPYLSKND